MLVFQSTPVITDGRTRRQTWQHLQRLEFQSTPVITDGRTLVGDYIKGQLEVFQSTPVITDGRTGRAADLTLDRNGLNPRPSSLTGERVIGKVLQYPCAVSIHARHH